MTQLKTFQAQTGSFPGSIYLEWSLDQDLGTTEQVRIRRAESVYPLSTEGEEVVASGDFSLITFKDEDLNPDIFYYYTFFIYDTSTSVYTEFGRLGQTFALSYRAWGEGDRLYKLIATDVRSLDEVNNFNLKKLILVMGNMMDYYRSLVTTMGYWRKPELVSENLLDFYSLMLGFPPERGFDLRVLRNLALGLVSVYKRKGTCIGLVDFIKIFTTWDSACDDTVDLTFQFWDPETKRRFAYLTGVGSNKATDANASFAPGIWQGGKFCDELDEIFYRVLGNDATSIFFDGQTPPFDCDTGTTGVGLSATDFQDTSKAWTTDQWRGFRLYIDAFSPDETEYFVVIGNNTNTLFLNPKVTNFGTPEVLQPVGIDMVAPTDVEYRIEPEYYIQTGKHSLTYDNTVPPGFRGSTRDPANFYVGGNRSLLSLGQFSPLAVLVIIFGVALFGGRSTSLAGSILTDTNNNFGVTDSLVGKRLNPNVLQAKDFEIIANTVDSITVLGDMEQVAATANNYYITDDFSSIKIKRLREVIPEFVPRDVDIFLFFEPI